MRLKCELYKKEQDELMNKVIQILNYIYMKKLNHIRENLYQLGIQLVVGLLFILQNYILQDVAKQF